MKIEKLTTILVSMTIAGWKQGKAGWMNEHREDIRFSVRSIVL